MRACARECGSDQAKSAPRLGNSQDPHLAKATPPHGGSPGARPVIAPGLDQARPLTSAVLACINFSLLYYPYAPAEKVAGRRYGQCLTICAEHEHLGSL